MTTRMVRSIGLVAASVILFASASAAQFEQFQLGGVGITVFQDESFRGENATFRQDVPDLRQYGFDDRITSLRVAPGEYWEGCELPNYRGRCQVFSGDERNLRSSAWSDRISSLRRVRGEGGGGGGFEPPIGKVGIVLYDDPFFRGRSITLKDPTDNLRFQNFHDRAESVRVIGGTWELCAEPRFRKCQTVDRDIAHLSTIGLNKKLSSARPARWDSGGGNPPPYPGVGGSTRIILCGASGGGQVECRTNGYASSVRLVREQSNGICRQGYSWGYTDSFIWTNKGCRGEFEVNYREDPVWGGGGSAMTRVISCGSDSGDVSCNPFGEVASARLIREESYRRCRRGVTWGYTPDDLWTKDGCKGDFEVTYRVRPQPR